MFDINETLHLLASNHVLITPDHHAANDFQLALKLVDVSNSSLSVGVKGNTAAYVRRGFYGRKPLDSLPELGSALVHLVNCIRKQKSGTGFNVKCDFFHGMYDRALRQETRFIELSILLETLLLPNVTTELSYRFALRLANVLARKLAFDISKTYKLGKTIYSTRSRLVHSGHDRHLASILPEAMNIARLVFKLFLEQPDLFSVDRLDALCLGA